MDLAELCRVVRRRWYITLPGLLLTLALTAGAYWKSPVTYQSQSMVALLNSQQAARDFDGNPFLSTQASLTNVADSLARSLNSDGSAAELAAQGVDGPYQAMLADNAQGPLLLLTVTGTDPGHVLTSSQALTAYAANRLKQFQVEQAVAPNAMIRMTTILPPNDPLTQAKRSTKPVVVTGLLALALSVSVAWFVDARRRPRPVPEPVRAAETAGSLV
ncbi:chain length determinant protein [Streptomyces sp. H39-S7]|uniref:chain length determinant protein n=1 Tax=Streptomyces sp. H39-S7 TaxID=3004357 RepID=UPI0022B076F9|nr:chain length determinant protein [Streptomyces sp. H39-S7]MCZ4123287.1 chain length determinant protein [Streptomyces sp. H39-S7]